MEAYMKNCEIKPIRENGQTFYPVLIERLLVDRLEKDQMTHQVASCEEHGLDIYEQIQNVEDQCDYVLDGYTEDATLYSRRNKRGMRAYSDGSPVQYEKVESASLKLIVNEDILMGGTATRSPEKLGFNVRSVSQIIESSIEEYDRRTNILGRCPIVDDEPSQSELLFEASGSCTGLVLQETDESPDPSAGSVILDEKTILDLLGDRPLKDIPSKVMSVLSDNTKAKILDNLYLNEQI